MSANDPKRTCPFNRFLTQMIPKGGRYAGDAAQRKGNGTMFTPLVIAFFVFAIILAGAFAGAVARRYVPQHHLVGGDKKRGLHIHGSGCYDFCLGSWALTFKREQLVQRSPGTSELDV